MSALPRIELISSDEHVVEQVSSAAAGSSRSFSLCSSRDPWSEPIGRAVRIVDLAAMPSSAAVMAAGRTDGLVLILPSDERHPCARFHVYARTELPALLQEILHELPVGAEAAGEILIGESAPIRLVREQIGRVAPYADVSVLVCGETGTGKELVAQAIHQRSCRPGAFVALNCAAVPETLFESELFGHEPGAFTGARTGRVGLLEAASQGTIFFDEIGEMPQVLQAKLLRVIETRTFRRLGSNRDLELEARIVSATNRPLHAAGADGHLRRDLRYRLAGFTIELPPLRRRVGDVELLASAFLARFARRHRRPPMRLGARALELLREQPWPGNVRELRATIEQVAIVTSGSVIDRDDVLPILRRGRPAHVTPVPSPGSHDQGFDPRVSGVIRTPLRDVERELILQAFEAAGGNLSRAASELGIPRTTLRDKLRRYGITTRQVGSG